MKNGNTTLLRVAHSKLLEDRIDPQPTLSNRHPIGHRIKKSADHGGRRFLLITPNMSSGLLLVALTLQKFSLLVLAHLLATLFDYASHVVPSLYDLRSPCLTVFNQLFQYLAPDRTNPRATLGTYQTVFCALRLNPPEKPLVPGNRLAILEPAGDRLGLVTLPPQVKRSTLPRGKAAGESAKRSRVVFARRTNPPRNGYRTLHPAGTRKKNGGSATRVAADRHCAALAPSPQLVNWGFFRDFSPR